MDLIKKIQSKEVKIGIIGLGYVGLPLVIEFCKAGFPVTGFDIDDSKIEFLKQGKSYIKHIDLSPIADCLSTNAFSINGNLDSPIKTHRFLPTSDFSKLSEMDCIIVCVPTPLNKYREPDMSYVLNTTKTIADYLRKGQLIVLESTTYPGTTDENMRAILEETGLKAGEDFYLAYSPEREDPNNKDFSTRTIPKVVGGFTKNCLAMATALYNSIVVKTIPVSSTRVAEATKLLENIYRAVNIALVNELKILFDRMEIDIWEVIEAAKTKPFGFQAFYPGPGLGGHCIPIDPFYLTWKAREYDFSTRFIELAGEINTHMPYYVVQRTIQALNERGKSLKGSKILILGVAYKPEVDDDRESPAYTIIGLLQKEGAIVDYCDPYIPKLKKTRKYIFNKVSIELTAENLKIYDVIIIVTNHLNFDYNLIEQNAQLIIDTRNAMSANNLKSEKIYKA